jgi:tRNA-specific adenosine deaminase 1
MQSSTMIRWISTVRKTKKSSAATTASSNLIVHNPQRFIRRRKWNVKSNADTSRLPPITQEPSKRDLYIVALHQSIPFIGFGMMDNSVLILAGEAIDIELGTILNISTMCAAAIGNIIADLCGVAFGTVFATYLERCTRGRLILPPMPQLTYAQRELHSVKMYGQVGVCAGLTLGCIIGMFPLLFFSSEKKKEEHDNNKEAEES